MGKRRIWQSNGQTGYLKMAQKKEHLQKLFSLVNQVANEPGNEWFKNELVTNFGGNLKIVLNETEKSIKKIDEHFFKAIATKQAENFYRDFKLTTIKDKLILDFVRMEQFRREDNFEDFCLATYQQLESIINTLIESEIVINYFKLNKDLSALLKFDLTTQTFIPKGNQTVGKLIFLTSDQKKINDCLNSTLNNWFFNHKLRAIIYYFYFNKEVKNNTELFDKIYEVGKFLYQGRNLNHRGSTQSLYQQNILNELLPNQYKYYFKFLGFLEDFISNVNKNITI